MMGYAPLFKIISAPETAPCPPSNFHMNKTSSMPIDPYPPLMAKLRDKEYRDGYVAAQISIGLPFQIRALHKGRPWVQSELVKRAGRAGAPLSLGTLKRIAATFDVGLEVRFVPFSELIRNAEGFEPDSFSIKNFEEEIEGLSRLAEFTEL